MEKLIRLINEYGKTSNCGPFETCRLEPATDYASSYLVLSRDDNGEGDWKDWHLPIPRLISKEYGFIKWLVENEKVNPYDPSYNVPTHIALGVDDGDGDFMVYERFFKEEELLMLLSIQDNPIEFLVSILK